MAQATRDTTAHRYPPHVQIWEHPERAPKIKKLGGTWMGHCLVHITCALNELPPEGHVHQGLAGLPAPRRSGGGTP
jgi:hypothetical protein